MKSEKPGWLEIARELQALSQTGLAFSTGEYDRERYTRLGEIAAEILTGNTTLGIESVKKIFFEQPGYATPKIDVRSVVTENDSILLVQEKMDGKWALPGGWADVGDYPSEAAIRETKEESGLEVVISKLIGVFDANRSERDLQFFHAFKVIFLCKAVGGVVKGGGETLDAKFFKFDELPELSHHRTNMKHLNEIKEHLSDSLRPAYFD